MTNRSLHAGKTTYEPLNAAPALTSNQLTGFGYDAAGNMTSNGTIGYNYDQENRMTKFIGDSTDIYVYDGDGQRVKKNASSVALYWYGATGNVLDETNSVGTLLSEYIFFNGKRVARRDADNTVKYYFSDNLASTGVVTDATGTIVEESDYYPYGGEIVITRGDSNHYKFTGKERDSESTLDYFGARYYASNLARFITPDMGIFHPGDPQSLNRYLYSLNDPLRFVDPDGMNPIDAVLLSHLEHFASWAEPIARARVSSVESGGAGWRSKRSADDLRSMHTFGLDDWSDQQANGGRLGAENDLFAEQMENLTHQVIEQVTAWANLPSTTTQEIDAAYGALEINQRGLDQTAESVKKTSDTVGTWVGNIPVIGKYIGPASSAISVGASAVEDSYQRYLTQVAQSRLEQARKKKEKDKKREEEENRVDKNRQLNPK